MLWDHAYKTDFWKIVWCMSLLYLFQSSLLMSLLGELPLTSGSVKVTGKVAYVAQQPWVFSASVRQNVTFGLPFDAKRYQQVIKAAALTRVSQRKWWNIPIITHLCAWIFMSFYLFFNTLRPQQNGHHSALYIFECISGTKVFVFWCKFLCSLFFGVQLLNCQHWFR